MSDKDLTKGDKAVFAFLILIACVLCVLVCYIVAESTYGSSVRNDFKGNVTLYAEGICTKSLPNCYDGKINSYIGGSEVPLYPVFVAPIRDCDAGEAITLHLIENNNYKLYEKQYHVLWVNEVSYFIECVD